MLLDLLLGVHILEFFLFFSMLTHGVLLVLEFSGEVKMSERLVEESAVEDLGVQSEARALIGEHGEMMLSGEAGLGGEGLARNSKGLSSSSGEVGGGDLDGVECLLSLWLVFRFLFFRELEAALGEMVAVVWAETTDVSALPPCTASSSLPLAPDSIASSPNLPSRK